MVPSIRASKKLHRSILKWADHPPIPETGNPPPNRTGDINPPSPKKKPSSHAATSSSLSEVANQSATGEPQQETATCSKRESSCAMHPCYRACQSSYLMRFTLHKPHTLRPANMYHKRQILDRVEISSKP